MCGSDGSGVSKWFIVCADIEIQQWTSTVPMMHGNLVPYAARQLKYG